jgi:selenocysteine lyase/cysteine desulfurase
MAFAHLSRLLSRWLRGPAGTCLVYIHPTVVSTWQPLDQHDRTRDWHGESIAYRNTLTPEGYPSNFLPGARKLDAGGRSQPILMPMLRAALEKVVEIDPVAAQTTLHALMQPLRDWVAESEVFSLPGQAAQAGHLMGLSPTSLSPEALKRIASDLAKEGVLLSVRCGLFRISPYLDNTGADVQKLVDALRDYC